MTTGGGGDAERAPDVLPVGAPAAMFHAGPDELPDELAAALRVVSARLGAAGVPSPRADSTALAGHVLGLPVAELAAAAVLGRRLNPDQLAELLALTRRRERRVPLQHLTGTAAFRTLTLAVGSGVFVPRPETELTAQLAIDELRSITPRSRPNSLAVDLCTGSGAIALALATEVPAVTAYAVELSSAALAFARRNVEQAGLADRVRLIAGDARVPLPELAPVEGRADVVTCNPPYIPPDGVPVDPEVREHDPGLALYGGGPDGLDLPTALAARASSVLRPGGLLVMEHADGQWPALAARLERAGWVELADHRDLSGRSRVVTARTPVQHAWLAGPGEHGPPGPR